MFPDWCMKFSDDPRLDLTTTHFVFDQILSAIHYKRFFFLIFLVGCCYCSHFDLFWFVFLNKDGSFLAADDNWIIQN